MKMGLFYVAWVLAFAYGWIMNIVTIVNAGSIELTGLMVLRFIGVIVAPLGAVLGYF